MTDYQYRIVHTSNNAVRVSPYIGKRFSDEVYQSLKLKLSNMDEVSIAHRDGAGIRVVFKDADVDMDALIEDSVPKAKTKREIRSEAHQAKVKHAESLRKQAYDTLRKEEPQAYEWVESTFGKSSLNEYNSAAMVTFITGRASQFLGLLNHRCFDGLLRIRAGKQDQNGGMIVDFERIKSAYLADQSEQE